MAAYNYYGQNYANPYQMYTAGYQQPVMQPQVQPQMPPAQMPGANQQMQNNSIIWVSGLAEAQAFPTAPNSAVVLWENSGKTIFLKSADATGKPSIRIYDLVERTEAASAGQERSAVKTTDYATKEDVAAIAGAVKGILSDLDSVKSDLYGLSGKRKTTKKTEAEAEE